MKTDFEERKAAKLERFQELAQKNEQLSTDLFNQSDKMASVIPMGQPILIGHHSEKRDRAYREKIFNKMGASVEASKKAEYYKERAESLLNNTAISSDDPNALDKLEEKLIRLQDKQELYKLINKIVKNTKLSDIEKLAKFEEIGIKENSAIKLMDETNFGGAGIPSFTLTNNNAKINNTAKRIKHLQSIEKLHTAEIVINGVTLKQNVEANRMQIFFPDIPSEAIRTELKRNGYHWSPSEKAWMRQISNSAIYAAKQILNSITV